MITRKLQIYPTGETVEGCDVYAVTMEVVASGAERKLFEAEARGEMVVVPGFSFTIPGGLQPGKSSD